MVRSVESYNRDYKRPGAECAGLKPCDLICLWLGLVFEGGFGGGEGGGDGIGGGGGKVDLRGEMQSCVGLDGVEKGYDGDL